MTISTHVDEVRQHSDKRGVDLISDCAPIRSPVVWRTKRNQQCSNLGKVFQPVT